ncbi:MAG: hypothetical protein GC149_14745 [Gammaproteobacteria bacterium]|nr:hypothetical protein [Gammaproteobacteria bacterium]
MEEREEQIKAVEKVLGEPVICEFDSKTQKMRTTLFLLSVISIAYMTEGLKIDKASSVLGFKFDGLTDNLFRHVLFITILYLTIHFLWSSWDCFIEWRLRITGTRLAFSAGAATFGSDESDSHKNPKQSTLYNWWKSRASSKSYEEFSTKLNELFNELTTDIQNKSCDELKANSITSQLQSIRGEIAALNNFVAAEIKILESNRIPASLKRFDSWFKLFLKSQNIRWFFIEFLLPITLSLAAIILLF